MEQQNRSSSFMKVFMLILPITVTTIAATDAWNNGKEVPRWGVAEIQKMSPSTTGRCK